MVLEHTVPAVCCSHIKPYQTFCFVYTYLISCFQSRQSVVYRLIGVVMLYLIIYYCLNVPYQLFSESSEGSLSADWCCYVIPYHIIYYCLKVPYQPFVVIRPRLISCLLLLDQDLSAVCCY